MGGAEFMLMLQRCGIQPRYDILVTLIDGESSQIGKELNSSVGLIFGYSIDLEGPLYNNNSALVIEAAEAGRLFLTLKNGQDAFINAIRLDKLIFNQSSSFWNSDRFLFMPTPGTFDLTQSFYSNPGDTVSDKYVNLNIWYITPDDIDYLVEKKLMAPKFDLKKFLDSKKKSVQ